MPMYDVDCPNCGVYERAKPIAQRRDLCDRCGSPIELLITSSTKSKGFEPYFNIGLGMEVTGVGDINRAKRQHNLDDRPHPSPGDISARRDRIEQRRKAQAARR